ncbi:ComEC/Rec2 family competence protein [Kitasatospora sp. NPDC086009]|uniref:ComEC/Rec2 family competence protein n=1 Tax=unclassified Kitasatospora TaxID=2633591 RepID=UPI0037CAEE7A
MITVQLLPAAHGDALWIEWPGPGGEVHRMLVDGGPNTTYRAVFDRVSALPKPDRHLDVLVVTHVDADHIEGVVRLLQDRTALGLSIGDVWFNGWPQLTQDADLLGADQGEMLQALIGSQHLAWNAAFRTARVEAPAVRVPARGPLPSAVLPGGARVTVVSPGGAELLALRKEWTKVLKGLGVTPGRPGEALERLARRKDLRGLADDLLGGERVDGSVPNGSSIAFLLEVGDHRVLLTGDGHGDVLARGLTRLLAERGPERGPERGADRLAVDALKVPHHGSAANTTDELLALLATRRFLISTNGDKFKHPDRAAVLRLIGTPERTPGPPELVFNYRSPTTDPWADPDRQRTLGYTAVYPPDAPGPPTPAGPGGPTGPATPAAPAAGTTVEV